MCACERCWALRTSDSATSNQVHRCNGEVSPERQPHAVLDLPSRRLKGLKIERLLRLSERRPPLRMLEVGTGSGGIAHYFGTHPELCCEVDAVDVIDNRLVTESYRYHEVVGTQLPFADETFDVVLSNHVIEHVGNQAAQTAHLVELHRVLRTDGVGYLAVPNRWMLVEPHFRLPFLSWLPKRLSNTYVRAAGKGTHYDCLPLTCARIEPMLSTAGFGWRQHTGEALRLTYELERPDARLYRWLLRHIPVHVFKPVRRVFPTLIYTLTRR